MGKNPTCRGCSLKRASPNPWLSGGITLWGPLRDAAASLFGGQVKIQGQNKEMLAAACQMFLGKSESEIAQIALETLEGHQRAIMAHMTVEVSGG